MPYTEKQHKLFRALEHGWKPDDPKLSSLENLGRAKLRKMANEGIRESPVKARKK